MNKLNDWPYGCYIDGSHWNDREFTIEVIRFAGGQTGFQYDEKAFDLDLQRLASEECESDEAWEIVQEIEWLYLQAMDYLNENVTDGAAFWFVEDSSLFYNTEEGGMWDTRSL